MGKLTVAAEVQRLSGYKLFHNHPTVNALTPVFEFGTDPVSEVLRRVRLDVFETAARHGTNLICTNNSVWGTVPKGDPASSSSPPRRQRVSRVVTAASISFR